MLTSYGSRIHLRLCDVDEVSAGVMSEVAVNIEPALQHEVSALLSESDSVAAALYPGEYRRPITAGSLAKPGTYVLIARLADRAVGLCVLFERGDGTTELKRMIVDAGVRGAGIGMALLRRAEVQALTLGAQAMLLEVGTRNIEAQQLYRRGGYKPCEPFAPYTATPISLFMRRSLIEAVSGR
ncbi:MAG: GNAT family N-acetyltransferase [Rhizobium sp.]